MSDLEKAKQQHSDLVRRVRDLQMSVREHQQQIMRLEEFIDATEAKEAQVNPQTTGDTGKWDSTPEAA